VIVNDALDQQFPELEGMWTGRIAYTAYLHVGLPKSWILQYSLPRGAEAAPVHHSALKRHGRITLCGRTRAR